MCYSGYNKLQEAFQAIGSSRTKCQMIRLACYCCWRHTAGRQGVWINLSHRGVLSDASSVTLTGTVSGVGWSGGRGTMKSVSVGSS